ncbi:MAG: formylglycine-generating enzyme family protein [Pseudomonadota bacterium]
MPSSESQPLTISSSAIPGGDAIFGTDHPVIPADEEGPLRRKRVAPFAIMQTTVTNAMFDAFVSATGYISEAERFGWSYVFQGQLPEQALLEGADSHAQWWFSVQGANWKHIVGPQSDMGCNPEHPVVHVSWNDAQAFAEWAGGRLPSEVEWEHAARGGRGDVLYPWGNDAPNGGELRQCNIWQGQFPECDLGKDCHPTTAPAQSFEPNSFGLYNMVGNVWEWTSVPFKVRSISKQARKHAKRMRGTKVLKGGSFLCHQSYCYRYRIAARTGTTPDSTTSHQGFRLVFDI